MADRLLELDGPDAKLQKLIRLLAVQDGPHSAWGEFPKAAFIVLTPIASPPRAENPRSMTSCLQGC
jgi:hypothetical protein